MHLVGLRSVDIERVAGIAMLFSLRAGPRALRGLGPVDESRKRGGLHPLPFVVERAFDAVTICEQGLECISVAIDERATHVFEVTLERRDLIREAIGILNHELGPHMRIEVRHAREIPVAAGREPVVLLRRGGS